MSGRLVVKQTFDDGREIEYRIPDVGDGFPVVFTVIIDKHELRVEAKISAQQLDKIGEAFEATSHCNVAEWRVVR